MHTVSATLTYTDQPNGSVISFEPLPHGLARFVIHPKGWIFGQHSFRQWLRSRIPYSILTAAGFHLLWIVCMAIFRGKISLGSGSWTNFAISIACSALAIFAISFADDWITKAQSAVIEIRKADVMIEKSYPWRLRRRIIPRAKIDRVIHCMGAVRFRQRRRVFDLINVACCEAGDQKWLARKLRTMLDLPERTSAGMRQPAENA